MADDKPDLMLREAAKARGFRLVKSRRRKPGGDFGRYGLVDLKSGRECLGFGDDGFTATAEEIHAYLRGGEVASWKRSLIGSVETPRAPAKKERANPSPSAKAREGAPRRPSSPPAFAGGAGGGSSSSSLPPKKPPQPPPELAIRDAARRDAAAIAKLLAIPAKLLAERLAAALRAGEPPLVAERGGIVGILAWSILPTLQDGPRGRITLLLVAEDERRKGVGRTLLNLAAQRLSDAGATSLEMNLDVEFDAPAGFLRRTGWNRTANGYGKDVG